MEHFQRVKKTRSCFFARIYQPLISMSHENESPCSAVGGGGGGGGGEGGLTNQTTVSECANIWSEDVYSSIEDGCHVSVFIFLSWSGRDVPPNYHVFTGVHCKCTVPKIMKQVFLELKLHGFVPNFHIHVSVSDLYIPTTDAPILLQQSRWTDRGNLERVHAVSFLGVHKSELVCSVDNLRTRCMKIFYLLCSKFSNQMVVVYLNYLCSFRPPIYMGVWLCGTYTRTVEHVSTY